VVAVVVLVAAAAIGVVLRDVRQASAAGGTDPATSTTAAVAASQQPGAKTVVFVADAAAHPDAARVRALLQNYFDAINQGNYQLWSSTVLAQRTRDTNKNDFLTQYRSTVDTSIVVHRLEAWPGGGLLALISFTSVQDPAYAPPDLRVRCLRWRVSYPLVTEAGQLRIGMASPNTSLREPC
jgi:hypothetical protein